MDGFSLLLLFVFLWLIDRLLNAGIRRLNGSRARPAPLARTGEPSSGLAAELAAAPQAELAEAQQSTTQ
ncbi:MAG: hypothetical protein AB9900_03145 [Humidesulfovibrio sp.]